MSALAVHLHDVRGAVSLGQAFAERFVKQAAVSQGHYARSLVVFAAPRDVDHVVAQLALYERVKKHVCSVFRAVGRFSLCHVAPRLKFLMCPHGTIKVPSRQVSGSEHSAHFLCDFLHSAVRA